MQSVLDAYCSINKNIMLLNEAYNIVITLANQSCETYEGIPKQKMLEAIEAVEQVWLEYISKIDNIIE